LKESCNKGPYREFNATMENKVIAIVETLIN